MIKRFLINVNVIGDVHASSFVINTETSNIPSLKFTEGSINNETPLAELAVRNSDTGRSIISTDSEIHSNKYGRLNTYPSQTYTVTDTDALSGMAGSGTLILPPMSSQYSVGRSFWVAPVGGDILVTYTSETTTITENVSDGGGLVFVVTSSKKWAKIGGTLCLTDEEIDSICT